jgi:hypothetical protein
MASASYLVANPNVDLITVGVEQGVEVCQDHVRLFFSGILSVSAFFYQLEIYGRQESRIGKCQKLQQPR